MKPLLMFILIISILSSCDRKKSDNDQSGFKLNTEVQGETKVIPKKELETIQSKIEKDTIKNYWALILDTISSKKEFNLSGLKYNLELKTYSLNDSSIVRNLDQTGERPYLDHSHKMVTDLTLMTTSTVAKKQLDRTDFETSLMPEFYADCNLISTEIDSVLGNTIYLNSSLGIPDSDTIWGVWYSLNVENKQLGNFQIVKTDYIGL